MPKYRVQMWRAVAETAEFTFTAPDAENARFMAHKMLAGQVTKDGGWRREERLKSLHPKFVVKEIKDESDGEATA